MRVQGEVNIAIEARLTVVKIGKHTVTLQLEGATSTPPLCEGDTLDITLTTQRPLVSGEGAPPTTRLTTIV